MNWRHFFESYRLIPIAGDNDLLFQVGATVGGRPIGREQFDQTIADVEKGLMLDPSDHLLDLACGNGVITHRLASEVKSVVGVDFSQPYIDNARRYKSLPNVEYICGDVCDLRTTLAPVQKRFSKVLMHSALAYFSLDQFAALLVDLDAHLTQDARIYIAAVPDSGKRWRFYNTWRRAAVYVWNSLRGKESGIGKWWRKKELIRSMQTAWL